MRPGSSKAPGVAAGVIGSFPGLRSSQETPTRAPTARGDGTSDVHSTRNHPRRRRKYAGPRPWPLNIRGSVGRSGAPILLLRTPTLGPTRTLDPNPPDLA